MRPGILVSGGRGVPVPGAVLVSGGGGVLVCQAVVEYWRVVEE